MNKLINLLNKWLLTSDLYEFYDKIYYEEFCWGKIIKIMAKIRQKYKATGDRDADMTHLICLKQYEFIKWLVDNNKIDWNNKIPEYWGAWSEYRCDDYENILINLALNDEPLKFLVSIIK